MARNSFIVVACALVLVLCTVSARGELDLFTEGNFIDDFFSEDSLPIDWSDREKAEKMIRVNHALPRYTFFTSDFTITRVPARFCLPRGFESGSSFSGSVVETSNSSIGMNESQTYSLDQCDWSDYAESLLLISFIAFLIAVIIFPFLFCGLSWGRCCCCGNYKPTPTLCGHDSGSFNVVTDGYTDCCVMALFILSIACCVTMAAGAGVGIWGSVVMTDNVNQVADFTNKTTYAFVDVLRSVVSILRQVREVQNITEVIKLETLEDADNIGDKATNFTHKLAKYSNTIDLPRQIFMYITLLLPLVLMILVVISRFCGYWLTWGMSVAGFILTFLSLCTFGFLYPLAAGLSDLCIFMDNSLEDPEYDTFLNSIFKCGPDSTLADIADEAVEAFNTAENISCSVYDFLSILAVPCDKDGDGKITALDLCPILELSDEGECNISSLGSKAKSTKIYNRGLGCYCEQTGVPGVYLSTSGCSPNLHSTWNYSSVDCQSTDPSLTCRPMYCELGTPVTMEECSTNCIDQDMAVNASAMLTYAQVSSDIFDLYSIKIKPYLNCESVVDITNGAKDFICVNMINAVTPMYVGEIIGAAGTFVGTFVALLSTKRFNKNNRISYGIRQERHEAVEL